MYILKLLFYASLLLLTVSTTRSGVSVFVSELALLVNWDRLIRGFLGIVETPFIWLRARLETVVGGGENHQEGIRCCYCESKQSTMPYKTNCGHVYCYYCLHALCEKDKKRSCIKCGQQILRSDRL